MRDKLRWLAVPPALALLLMFGPWRTVAPRPLETGAAPTTTAGTTAKSDPTPRVPSVAMPDLTQTLCTVVGVCLLGTAVVLGLARARGRAPSSGSAIVVRQSVRLSNRHAVHAVEFAERLLLLGECDGSLAVLHAGDEPDAVTAARAAPATHGRDDEDDGVVLKDMVIPRPPRPGVGAALPTPGKQPQPSRGLSDFRTLLGKTRVKA